MYCDFCGTPLSYQGRYCRQCGRKIKDGWGDTQPLPVVNETMLYNAKEQSISAIPWYKSVFRKKTFVHKSKVQRMLYHLLSLVILAALIYILTTFQTIKEYQRLTATWGGLWVVYLWWKYW